MTWTSTIGQGRAGAVGEDVHGEVERRARRAGAPGAGRPGRPGRARPARRPRGRRAGDGGATPGERAVPLLEDAESARRRPPAERTVSPGGQVREPAGLEASGRSPGRPSVDLALQARTATRSTPGGGGPRPTRPAPSARGTARTAPPGPGRSGPPPSRPASRGGGAGTKLSGAISAWSRRTRLRDVPNGSIRSAPRVAVRRQRKSVKEANHNVQCESYVLPAGRSRRGGG